MRGGGGEPKGRKSNGGAVAPGGNRSGDWTHRGVSGGWAAGGLFFFRGLRGGAGSRITWGKMGAPLPGAGWSRPPIQLFGWPEGLKKNKFVGAGKFFCAGGAPAPRIQPANHPPAEAPGGRGGGDGCRAGGVSVPGRGGVTAREQATHGGGGGNPFVGPRGPTGGTSRGSQGGQGGI